MQIYVWLALIHLAFSTKSPASSPLRLGIAIPHEGPNMHRFLIASTTACALISSVASFAGDYESAFPYKVQIVTAAAPLRCGPGEAFYVTELLDRGRSLTVYRQTPSGWLAVRPTKASFSLVAARYARATEEQDVVEVVGDHAVSWVGSSDVQPNEFRWQVRLKLGEKVVVRGEEHRRTYPGGLSELHYRIAPPSGEFRWIHENDVRHASHVETFEPEIKGNIQLTDFRVVVEEADSEPRRDDFVARRHRRSTTNTDDNGDSDERSHLVRRAARVPVAPQSDLPPLGAAEFEERLRDLDVQLSLMVARPVDDWQLAELSEDVNDLISRGGTTVDRGRALLLAEKMDEFAQLLSRHQTAGGTKDPSNVAETAANVKSARPATPSNVDPRFDGVGWLYPVHSRSQASPPYALLDADGTILQFVSPAPGFNLHRYLRKEIGVFGQQAISARLDKPHVTAQRVVSLKRHRR